jgi:hypothetical protein
VSSAQTFSELLRCQCPADSRRPHAVHSAELLILYFTYNILQGTSFIMNIKQSNNDQRRNLTLSSCSQEYLLSQLNVYVFLPHEDQKHTQCAATEKEAGVRLSVYL